MAEKKEVTCFLCHKTEHQGCFASVPEGRPGPVGMYTVPAHIDPRRLIKGVILRKEE